MTTFTISLPESMQAFVEEQVAKGGYSTACEYIRQLIHQHQKQGEKQQIEALLLEGLNSGEPMEIADAWWEQKRASLIVIAK